MVGTVYMTSATVCREYVVTCPVTILYIVLTGDVYAARCIFVAVRDDSFEDVLVCPAEASTLINYRG